MTRDTCTVKKTHAQQNELRMFFTGTLHAQLLFIDLPHGGLTNTMQALTEAYLSNFNLTEAQSDRLLRN